MPSLPSWVTNNIPPRRFNSSPLKGSSSNHHVSGVNSLLNFGGFLPILYNHGNLRYPPQSYPPPPINKALLRAINHWYPLSQDIHFKMIFPSGPKVGYVIVAYRGGTLIFDPNSYTWMSQEVSKWL